MKKPELLCPAGNFEKLRAAVDYGADAVYFSGNCFGMRAAAGNFTVSEIAAGVSYAHARNAKAYLTVNVMPHGEEYKRLEKYIYEVKNTCIDAVIVADLGVMALLRRISPELTLHVSTQANVVSAAACRAYAALGAKRIVLARELSLAEIAEIRRELPEELELECFVHGSMCIATSGRCLLSNYYTGRDANRGQCAQPCRWEYTITERNRPGDPLLLAEERGRYSSGAGTAAGSADEDSDGGPDGDVGGTFIMSSKDLSMIDHIPELVEAGVDSLKIEGRMKSAYYTAVVTNTYRMALDAYAADPAGYVRDPAWTRELSSVSHREYGTGFFFDRPTDNAQTVPTGGYIREKAYLATALTESDEAGFAWFSQRNKFCAGDTVELISPGKIGRPFPVTAIFGEKGEPLSCVPHPTMKFHLRVPFPVAPGDILRQN